KQDISMMLEHLGLRDVDDLFAHLPIGVLVDRSPAIEKGVSEPELQHTIAVWARSNRSDLICFAGAGYYDHYVSPTVKALTFRPEFVTAYTPYQAEVSQGMLQVLYEYQSMICGITEMDITNASLYDGATAAAEAVNAAMFATRRSAIWVSSGVSPRIRETIRTQATARDIEVVEHPLVGGRTVWATDAGPQPAAVLWAQPNYLGAVEDYDAAVTAARQQDALAVVSYDPMTLGVLRSPGSAGVDIAVGEGQALGNSLSFGGPGLGLFSITTEYVRRMPGRIIGRTVDRDGATAYVMTLRAREQDIRRAKASSNICSNEALNAVAAAVQLGWLGPDGLAEVGEQSAQKAHYLAERLEQIPGVRRANEAPFVREFAVLLPMEPEIVIEAMADRGYLAGVALSKDYPDLPGGLLIAVTERRSRDELDGYVSSMREVITNG
ncbi:MAG TPA: aminomethyl-transferring glycine dehydrogenase subunit GcvPA, partial [Actinobacteria bacterium]|nr:aminomethyl-transferring glycine dehydrogenase subunit GcvPA [Actinomycetota bacterium]